MILLNNVDTDTTSTPFTSTGGTAIAVIRGDDFGGGTVTLQGASANDPSARFADLSNGAFTANGDVKLDYLPAGYQVRADFAGSSGPSNVFVEIIQ